MGSYLAGFDRIVAHVLLFGANIFDTLRERQYKSSCFHTEKKFNALR